MGELVSSFGNKSSYIDPEAILARVVETLVPSPEKDVSFGFSQEPERGWGGA